ncbi:hypothetical protein RI129_006098 [Pyrocoelia pectoralis]|uniref:Osiris 10 n=1 Tax=Pyrocoelia pectoralis TaxID=417401 RepID=A0AAN7ZN85_9COLE
MFVFEVLCVAMITHLGYAALLDSFNQCLISTPTSFGYCLGIGALSKLQSIDNNPEFDVVDGVTFAKDEQEVRENSNFLNRDPGDLRTIVDSVGDVFSRRSLKWDMSVLYPGLTMRVAPSSSPGGILEFVLDPHREALGQHSLKEVGTGRLIAKQFLLPLLLGFKFSIATLIPIMFGVLALLAKKFIFISKLGLIMTTAIGLGSLLFKQPYLHHGHGGHYSSQHGQYGLGSYNRYQGDYNYYPDDTVKDENEAHTANMLFNNIQHVLEREEKSSGGKRNFAWNDSEKKAKR